MVGLCTLRCTSDNFMDLELVTGLSLTHRKALFEGDADPWRTGTTLRDFPTRKLEGYILARIGEILVGCFGILQHVCTLNGQVETISGFGCFYVTRELRGTGIGEAFHPRAVEFLRQIYPAACGMMGFCQPALQFYYTRLGAEIVQCPVSLKCGDGRLASIPQVTIWWPFEERVRNIQSLVLRSYRW